MKNKIIQLFISCAYITMLASCGNKKDDKPKAPPPTAVNIDIVKKGTAVYFDEYPATVTAINQVNLRAQVTGYITGIFFKDGQHVNKGQLLYTIDQQVYQANLQQAIASLQVQQANLIKSQKDADRYHELDKNDAVAKQQVDYADAALEVSKKQVAQAQANVQSVKSSVQFSSIVASFSGTIGISQVKMGALVTANQTLLNTISSDDPMAADVEADQTQIPRMVSLQNDHSVIKDSVITLRLPNDSIYYRLGKVFFIDRAVNAQTGTIRVRMVFPNPSGILKPGMSTNVRIKNNNKDSLFLLIPYKAVTEQMGEYFVFIVNKVNDTTKAIQHKIAIGAHIYDKVVVKDGVKDGDTIVTDGAQKLRDNTPVRLGTANPTSQQQKSKASGAQ